MDAAGPTTVETSTGDALSVAVVGGGIAGLVAARRLALAGARVHLLEASNRLGGQVRTVEIAGRHVDVGAEALHVTPDVEALLAELGLGDRTVAAAPGSSWLWRGGRLAPLPAGVGPAGPTRLGPVLTSRVLTPLGLARAALEPLVPRARDDGDVAVGPFIARRFGRQVTERLVDPVLGTLHAGDVSRLSMRSTVPQLAAVTSESRSIVLASRRRGRGGPPSFRSFEGGLAVFVDGLLADTGVTVHRTTAVDVISPLPDGYLVVLAGRAPLQVDAVVLAVPAGVAAGMLTELAPQAARSLGQFETATVATVAAAYDRDAAEDTPALAGTGLLVASGSGRLLKAATFLGSKWPHLQHPERFLVRLSAGRAGQDDISSLDDSALVGRLHADLAAATGLGSPPVEAHVVRWPRALTQMTVGHADRVRDLRSQLAAHPRVALAGASLDGLGIASCVRSGEAAARSVLAALPVPAGARS